MREEAVNYFDRELPGKAWRVGRARL